MNTDSQIQRPRVLVVDDDEDFRLFVERVLTSNDVNVQLAHDGASAVALQQRASYPVQLLDLELPDCSGLELCRRLRCDDSVSVLIAVTAHRKSFEIIDAREAGFDDLIYKPLSPDFLTSIVRRELERTERWLHMRDTPEGTQ